MLRAVPPVAQSQRALDAPPDNLFAVEPSEHEPAAHRIAPAPKAFLINPVTPPRAAPTQQNSRLPETSFDSRSIDVNDPEDAPLPTDISTFVRIGGTAGKSGASFLPIQSGPSWVVRHPTCLWPQHPARSGGFLDQHTGIPLPRDLPPARGVWAFEKRGTPHLGGDETQLPHSPDFEITHGTLALWIRPKALQLGMFLTKDDYSTGNVFQLGHTHKGRLILRMGAKTAWSTKTAVLSDREWVHLAITITEAGAIVCVDGAKIPAATWKQMTGGAADLETGAKAGLTGNRKPWHLTTGADAAIGSFGIWGGPRMGDCLTLPEIRHLVNIGPQTPLRTCPSAQPVTHQPLSLRVVVPSKKDVSLRFGSTEAIASCPDELLFHDAWRPRARRRNVPSANKAELRAMFCADAYEDEIMFA